MQQGRVAVAGTGGMLFALGYAAVLQSALSTPR